MIRPPPRSTLIPYTTLFRSFSATGTLPESTILSVPRNVGNAHVATASSLFVIATVSSAQSGRSLSAVVVGASPRLVGWISSQSALSLPMGRPMIPAEPICMVGGRIGKQVDAEQGSRLNLTSGDQQETCVAAGIADAVGPED